MAKKNGVEYRTWFVDSNKYNIKSPYAMKAKKITIHNTDNEMGAHNEISYMRNNNNETSYHIAVDEKEAIQGLPFNRNGWHCGDGGNGYGNRNTIGIEICRNYDRSRRTTNLLEPLKSYYTDAEKNAIKVVAQICVDEGIVANVDNIKKHQDWSGKWCPSKILNEGRWIAFRTSVIAEYNRLMGTGASAPVTAPTTKKYEVKVTINGYVNAIDAKNKKNAKTKVGQGTYNIYKESEGMLNVSSKQGVAGSWINPDENKGGSTVAKPTATPVAPSKPKSNIIKSYNENETMYPNQDLKVYPEPLEWGKEVAVYHRGESVKYHKVHLGNGHLWLEYTRSSGQKGFIPFRTYNNGKYGNPKGTIGAPAKVAPKPPVEKIDKKYSQKGTFYPNKALNVHNRPSKNGSVVATYYSGESLTYHTVHEGNGYVWLQYTRASGKGEGYIPCRTYNGKSYGNLDGRIV